MATERYNAPVREKHWQQVWEEGDTFRAPTRRSPKRYQLEMFPYPSGRIHMGHVRNYTLGDVMARYMRAKGFNVLHPMGWDAFGLPAENAAMERKVHPRKWTYENIDTMRAQLKAMGLSIDWSREFATCDPDYYVHQQRLFLDFLKKRLAYRKTAKVNWDPVENTVLANEQVIDGRGWRSGALVEQRDLTQWFFRITAYAEELLEALDDARQVAGVSCACSRRNWIGRSDGVQHALRAGRREAAEEARPTLEIFTTRPRHDLRRLVHGDLARASAGAQAAAEEQRSSPPSSRSAGSIGTTEEALANGREEGLRHRHRRRASVRADVKLPVYVANFIVMGYGTGAIFGCPAHDQRDLDFARKYGRPVVPVVLPPGADAGHLRASATRPIVGDGTMINSAVPRRAHHRGGQGEDRRPPAKRSAAEAVGERKVNYRLRDWLHLAPALLGLPDPRHPLREVRHRAGAGRGPARRAAGGRHLRQARQPARPPSDLEARQVPEVRRRRRVRETDTMDTFVDSSWYFVPLHRTARRDAGRQEGGRLLAARRPVHRRHRARDPAPALLALLHARHVRHRPPEATSNVREPFARCSRRAWSCTRPTAARTATGCCRREVRIEGEGDGAQGLRDRDRRAGRDRLDREDVEVAQEHRRPRRHHQPATAPTPRAGSCSPTARPSATSSGPTSASQGARPLRAAHLAPDRRGAPRRRRAKGTPSPRSFGPEADGPAPRRPQDAEQR